MTPAFNSDVLPTAPGPCRTTTRPVQNDYPLRWPERADLKRLAVPTEESICGRDPKRTRTDVRPVSLPTALAGGRIDSIHHLTPPLKPLTSFFMKSSVVPQKIQMCWEPRYRSQYPRTMADARPGFSWTLT